MSSNKFPFFDQVIVSFIFSYQTTYNYNPYSYPYSSLSFFFHYILCSHTKYPLGVSDPSNFWKMDIYWFFFFALGSSLPLDGSPFCRVLFRTLILLFVLFVVSLLDEVFNNIPLGWHKLIVSLLVLADFIRGSLPLPVLLYLCTW